MVVDVAVGYTGKALKKAGGEAALKARLAVTESQINDAFGAAGVQGKVKFIHFFQADYTGGEDASAVFDAVRDAFSTLGKQAREVREAQYADLVSVLSEVPKAGGEYTAGIANTPQEPLAEDRVTRKGNTNYRERATDGLVWSAVDVDDVSTGTMAHELGHNFALWHDDATLADQRGPNWEKNPVFPYNRGWVTASKKRYSVMGYGSACSYKCDMVMRYSSPTEQAAGEALGDEDHDNARVLRATVPVVARYRTPPEPPQVLFPLDLSVSPAGGGDAKAAKNGPYDEGTKVTVTATPAAGYQFAGWTLDGKDAGRTNPLVVTMDARHGLAATFRPTTGPKPEPEPKPEPAPKPERHTLSVVGAPPNTGKVQLPGPLRPGRTSDPHRRPGPRAGPDRLDRGRAAGGEPQPAVADDEQGPCGRRGLRLRGEAEGPGRGGPQQGRAAGLCHLPAARGGGGRRGPALRARSRVLVATFRRTPSLGAGVRQVAVPAGRAGQPRLPGVRPPAGGQLPWCRGGLPELPARRDLLVAEDRRAPGATAPAGALAGARGGQGQAGLPGRRRTQDHPEGRSAAGRR